MASPQSECQQPGQAAIPTSSGAFAGLYSTGDLASGASSASWPQNQDNYGDISVQHPGAWFQHPLGVAGADVNAQQLGDLTAP